MKKVTLVVLVFLLLSPPAWGAGMLACTPYDKGVGYFVITCTATADASGSFPATSLSGVWPQDDSNQGGDYIFHVEFVPGSTAPTNGYEVSIKDKWGVDLLLGKGAALSN
ncbi:MAG: hypothetical protein M0033_08330, partial [Nitrospiraceae bacterium]|nr:hypothetical protein [Nitrospiraceae bacterium]